MNEIFWVKFPKDGQVPPEGAWIRVSEEEYNAHKGFFPCKIEPPRSFLSKGPKLLYTAPHNVAAESIAAWMPELNLVAKGKEIFVAEKLYEQARERIRDEEIRVRLRREEILMAGNGDEGMPENIAQHSAWNEPLITILDADGEHIAETDPDLADWIATQSASP